ncbi:RHO1 GDP-GTP exchange protein 2 [Mortierella sp. GBA43]|nr:RHO1 GDP-GTP exchange protein 2 [Mortierella sp. GBA43]
MASYTVAQPDGGDGTVPAGYTSSQSYPASPASTSSKGGRILHQSSSTTHSRESSYNYRHDTQSLQHYHGNEQAGYQSQGQAKASSMSRAKTIRDPDAQRRLAMQLEYQRSLAQISQGEADEAAYGAHEAASESVHDDYPTSASASSVIGPTVPFSAHGHAPSSSYSRIQIAQSPHHDSAGPAHYHQHPPQPLQLAPTHGSMAMGYPHVYTQQQQFSSYPSYPQQYHQPPSPQPQRVLHQSLEQPSYYTDMPTTPTSYTGSQLYSPTASSTSSNSSWVQSPQSFRSGSISHGSLHGSFSSGQYNYPVISTPPLSRDGQLLLDFNPGILSTIAVAFRQKMLDNEAKRSESENYGLEFPVTFTGKEAVDVVIELTKLDDRRHALAIVQSMEAQSLFFGGGDKLYDSNNDQYFFSDTALSFLPGKTDFPTAPTGVFAYSTKCYSYGCVPGDPTCYSYLCPNRKNIANALGRHNSSTSSTGSQENIWANSVSASVLASVSKKERNRQEAIFEVVTTEHNYVRDLELIEEIFIKPLRAGGIVDDDKVEEFIEDVFLNHTEIIALNKRLLEALRERQEENPVVERIGDILLSHIIGFEDAYRRYIPRIVLSEFSYKKEKSQNPRFAQFLDDCARHPEARRLGLHHFVGQPYQRIPRYPLLLNEVVKRTDETVDDRETVQEVIRVCTELGKRIDGCIPEGARRLHLLQLQEKIVWKSKEEHQDLKLNDKSRRLLFEYVARRKATFEVQATELRLFLFDHMLVMTREKRDKQGVKDSVLFQVSKNPIPLELVDVWPDDGKPASLSTRESLGSRPKSTYSISSTSEPDPLPSSSSRGGPAESKQIAPVTIQHRGRRGGEYLLYMTTKDRDEFMEQVELAKRTRQDAVTGNHLFKLANVAEMRSQSPPSPGPSTPGHPMDGKRVTCSAPYLNVLDGKMRMVVGTDNGVYVGLEDDNSSFRMAIKDINVTSISILENHHILLVLTGKVLKAFNISCLEPDADKALMTGQQVAKNVQYFTTGVSSNKSLVIAMRKKGANESQFSAFEPLENAALGTQQHRAFGLTLGKSKSEWFKLYREFYVASDSSQLLILSKLICVVCPRGFEILRLDSLMETRVYPTRTDPEFAFLLKKPESLPISMFKISSEQFLMCYTDFAFTMTKNGNLAKNELIEFEGRAESFAMVYPYIIAFESELIEIRHIETGALEQLILGKDIRLLYSDVDSRGNPVIHVAMVRHRFIFRGCQCYE